MRTLGRHLTMLIGQLVHPRARSDQAEFARHRAFIASHLSGGLIALCFLPIFLAVYGQPHLIEALAFVWFISPIAIALLLSVSGWYLLAQLMSTINLTALIVFGSAFTGGIESFLLPWLIVVPMEAALSRSRVMIAASSSLACVGVLAILVLHQLGMAQSLKVAIGEPVLLAAFGVSFAIAYAGSLALSIHAVYRGQENRVHRQNLRFLQTLENSGSLVTWHSPDGSVREVSGKASGLFDGEPASLLKDGMLERVHVADRPAFLTAISRAAQATAPVRVEYRLATSLPTLLYGPAHFTWAETVCCAMQLDAAEKGSAHPGVVAVTRSIDAFKTREFALIQARQDADANAQAKNQFISGLGHELRTPLNALLGFSALLSGRAGTTFSPQQQAEYAKIIHSSGEALLHFIDEISVMSKIEAGTLDLENEDVDLVELLNEVLGQARAAARERGISFNHNNVHESVHVTGDRDALAKAFGNILDNAVKYCGSGGKVSLQLGTHDDEVVVSVSDTGSGIERAHLPNVTRAFYSTDDGRSTRKRGTGLGLAYAKGVAELHHGALELDSELGGGTCVTVRLPLAKGHSDEPSSSKLLSLPIRKSA